MIEHALNSSTGEIEVHRSLRVWGQPGIQSEFMTWNQHHQHYIVIGQQKQNNKVTLKITCSVNRGYLCMCETDRQY